MPFNVFVSTYPFGATDSTPVELFKEAGISVKQNPYKRKIRSLELIEELRGMDGVIAGTERFDEEVLDSVRTLKVISRVGVGLDGIDFSYINNNGIIVTYTPQAPALAVAELTVGLILDLARQITFTDKRLRNGVWHRHMGKRLHDQTVGIIGVGRIGRRVASLLSPFHCRILGYDLRQDETVCDMTGLEYTGFNRVLSESDFITLHVPLTSKTQGFISHKELSLIKSESYIINTSRGGVIDEDALYEALRNKQISGAAVDVFEEEPYKGELLELDNIITTCHMGAATQESRALMEITATEDCIRVLKGQTPKYPVSILDEYVAMDQ